MTKTLLHDVSRTAADTHESVRNTIPTVVAGRRPRNPEGPPAASPQAMCGTTIWRTVATDASLSKPALISSSGIVRSISLSTGSRPWR